MFSSISFESILKLIYNVSKYFGFLLIKINFNFPEKISKSLNFNDKVFFAISFGISFYAMFFFEATLPIEPFTHSQLMDLGVNLMCRLTLATTFFLKVSSMLHGDAFFDLISDLYVCHLKVSMNEFDNNYGRASNELNSIFS